MKKLKLILAELMMIGISLLVLIPLALIVLNSVKDKAGAANADLSLPKTWLFVQNYTEVFTKGGMLRGYGNSIILSVLSVILIVVTASMMGYVIQRRQQKLISVINGLVLMGMVIPISVAPTYMILKSLNLSGTFIGLSLVYVAVYLPIATFIYTGAYKSIPRTLDEAASIDGCGPIRTLFNIILPLMKPATVTVIIISFMSVWNDMTMPLYFLNSPKKYTVVLSTYLFYGQKSSDWHLVFANIVLVSLPIVIVYFTLQKYVISGMTGGAIKE